MKSTDHIDKLLARYFTNESLTFAQKAELEEWRAENEALFNQLKTLSEELSPATNIEFNSQKAWNRVEPELLTKPKRQLLSRYQAMGIAASVLLIIGFSLLWYFQHDTQRFQYANTTAEQNEITLPDHSTVNVYPGASIAYTAEKKRGKRTLSLKGKAFFTVKKLDGRPFIVQAYHTEIKVMGTSFFVDAASAHHTDVKVKTGKVCVTSNQRNVVLTAGEQVVVAGDSMVKDPYSETQDSKPVRLKFNKTPLPEVITLLEETFHITIEMDPALKDNTITTIIETDDPESILTELSYLSKCEYRKTADNRYELYTE